MSDLDEKINEADILYKKIVSLENGINKDSTDNKNKLIESHEYINKIIGIYNELLDTLVFPNISLSTDIRKNYNVGKRILTEIETKMIEYSPKLSENELLSKHGVELHDNKEETQEITPGTSDPITLEEISDGQTIAYLIDEKNKNEKFPPPPPFIYDENNYGIRKLILSSKELKNPYTRGTIEKVYLYKAKVPNSEESVKKGGRRKTKNKRRKTIKTIKRRKNSKKTKR